MSIISDDVAYIDLQNRRIKLDVLLFIVRISIESVQYSVL